MEWYFLAFKKYAQFKGRARRKEYWMFFLFHIIVSLILAFGGLIFANESGLYISGLLFITYYLASLIPSIAVAVRRLHDTGKSGLAYLVIFIPGIGSIIFLVLMALEGDRRTNKYGDDPKVIKDFSAYDNIIANTN
ncbi:DUF805 domain-containing protein [Mangrovivirga sp. M17]|uniref:DUF805 domain-containing protein n=1 Tax=Mangrovivirga halotolerans TaxID=2993936 RepID=A0ABT3RPP7_9BACT|nr:DUF805 domain-containing protein [Mangrovivirga halotolerans]MCX2743140.1 DUF805 domain-containing protein [Mangrovivirga halotolerans]